MLVPEGGGGDVCVVYLCIFVCYIYFVGCKCWDSWPVTEVMTGEWKCLNLRQLDQKRRAEQGKRLHLSPLQTVGAPFTLSPQKDTSRTKSVLKAGPRSAERYVCPCLSRTRGQRAPLDPGPRAASATTAALTGRRVGRRRVTVPTAAQVLRPALGQGDCLVVWVSALLRALVQEGQPWVLLPCQ